MKVLVEVHSMDKGKLKVYIYYFHYYYKYLNLFITFDGSME
jgi:hypothetical protein